MNTRLFGLETEYALAAMDASGAPVEDPTGAFWRQALTSLPHLPAAGCGGVFLQNGGRLYVDCMTHPEIATPECTNPWDAVRYLEAGDRIIADLAARLAQASSEVHKVLVFKNNVDYSGTGATWGSHESYLHKVDPRQLPPQLLPFLASRIVFTGAGGFNPLSPGLVFTLSPRAWHIQADVSTNSTNDRGVFHTKDESLAGDGCHRLHLLCGESLCSQLASWLRVGTTALVLALAEAGVKPAEGVILKNHTEALHQFALDPECKVKVQTINGSSVGALEIQKHYLALAEANARRPFMPPWAPEVCREWRAILERLANGPAAVASSLDWAIKGALYEDRAARRGVPWDSWPIFTTVITQLLEALAKTEYAHKPATLDFILSRESPIAPKVRELTSYIEDNRQCWATFSRFIALRNELFEIDCRFSQLGEEGIFASLDRAGVLAHRLPGVDNIDHAVSNPPAEGRARLRGICVQRFANQRSHYSCNWEAVFDRRSARILDLSDPFTTEETWRELPVPEEDQEGFVELVAELFRVMSADFHPTDSPAPLRRGDRVVLAAPEPPEELPPEMARHVGTHGVVRRILRPDASGNSFAYVQTDTAILRWPSRCLRQLREASPW